MKTRTDELPPLIPAEAVQIGTSCFAVVFGDQRVDDYANLEPLDFHRIDERNAMLMHVGRFSALNGIKTGQLMAVFGVSRSTVERARKRFLDGGEAFFFAPRKGRGLSALTQERAERATRLLAERLSGGRCARRLCGIGLQLDQQGTDRQPAGPKRRQRDSRTDRGGQRPERT